MYEGQLHRIQVEVPVERRWHSLRAGGRLRLSCWRRGFRPSLREIVYLERHRQTGTIDAVVRTCSIT